MKIKSYRFAPLLLIFSLALLESCSSTTKATTIIGTWKDPEASVTTYNDFFVAVISKNQRTRTALEDNISGKLKEEGVKAVESLTIFPHTDKIDTDEEKKAAVEKIQGLGHDAIITVVLLRTAEEEIYKPGNTSYSPNTVGIGTGYYNPERTGYASFGSYYGGTSSLSSTPGYYKVNTLYYLQSNVYDAKTSKLVWSAKTETFNPKNIKNAAKDFAAVIVDAIKKAKLIREPEKI